jgi:hypothetical protein
MATWDDVRRIALGLPDTSEGRTFGNASWRVKDKMFIWERPLRKKDLEALGSSAPKGPILGVRVEHLGIKDVILESDPDACFTTPHFNGYPAVLVQLDHVALEALEEMIVEAWLAVAPKKLAKDYLATR